MYYTVLGLASRLPKIMAVVLSSGRFTVLSLSTPNVCRPNSDC